MVTIDIIPYCGASNCKNTEILACKISKYKDQHIVLDLDYEGWDIVEIGIEQIVKNICDELEMPYTQIEFTSSDRLTKSTVFKHTLHKDRLINNWATYCNNPDDIELPIANNYGLFLGRGTNERLYSFYLHKNWQYSHLGKASMHLDPDTVTEWGSDSTAFICEYNERWRSIKKILPYTDLDHALTPADNLYESTTPILWNRIYKDVSIEIVCETNTTADTFFVTEKTFRPIAYGRLFMVIGSPEFEQNLKRMGFDIFDDIIDKSYDSESNYIRVDAVFNSLRELLYNPVDMHYLLPRLEANKQVLHSLCYE